MAEHASQMYARNIQSLLELMSGDEGALHLDLDDEITAGACVTGGKKVEGGGMSHFGHVVVELTILVLAIFLGIEVISKVPTMLHTPLMSGTNAIHGIVLLRTMLVTRDAGQQDTLTSSLLVDRDHVRDDRTSSAASWSPTACWPCSRPSRAQG